MTRDHVAQAERDADTARNQLEHTLNEFRGRFTPGRMLDEALDYSRNGQVADFVRNLGGQVKHNPLPVALVGAGLAWLMLGRNGSSYGSDHNIEERYRASSDRLSDLDPEFGEPSLKDKAAQAIDAAGNAFASAADSAVGTYESATRSASDIAGRMSRGTDAISHRAGDVRRRTTEGLSRVIEEHPLVLGVVGLALGAVIGSALPGTKAEDRLAGNASADLKRRTTREMSEQADKAMDVAERAYDSAVKEGKQAASEAGWTSPEKKTTASGA